ncbi:MAG: hypothetical protein ABJA49_14455 [Betaproteobacteria bacterium]
MSASNRLGAHGADQWRGGWTWHTGSAGWMAQFIGESLPGMQRRG